MFHDILIEHYLYNIRRIKTSVAVNVYIKSRI